MLCFSHSVRTKAAGEGDACLQRHSVPLSIITTGQSGCWATLVDRRQDVENLSVSNQPRRAAAGAAVRRGQTEADREAEAS